MSSMVASRNIELTEHEQGAVILLAIKLHFGDVFKWSDVILLIVVYCERFL